MYEEIVTYLRECAGEVTTAEIAEKFFKLKNSAAAVALTAVQSILSKDNRCFQDHNGNWHVHKSIKGKNRIRDLPLTGVYVLDDPTKQSKAIYYVAIWNILPEPGYVWGEWLTDINALPFKERELLGADPELKVDPEANTTLPHRLARELESKIPVFLSPFDNKILSSLCYNEGEFLNEDTILIGELLKAAEIKVSRPLTLSSCLNAVFGSAQPTLNVLSQGERFAACIRELISLLSQKGIETREDLESKESVEREQYFEGKEFSFEDICSQPSTPGVYGFKNRNGNIIYIGKARNLKRRLMSYFKETEESPRKLQLIREESFSMLTYRCGSELECLIYEYRLIKKHKPALNKQIEINERKGQYSPIDDCIVLLPHSDTSKIMSFWFRRDQKILLKALSSDFKVDDNLRKEVKNFFFTEKLPSDNQDFPEMEIAIRWFKKNRDSICIVPVNRMGSEEEICENIKYYWNEFV